MANNAALAVDGKHFYLHLGRHHAARKGQGMGADCITQGDTCSAGHGQGLLTGIGLANRGLQITVGTYGGCPLGQLRQVDAGVATVQVHVSGSEFADLAESAAQAEFIHRHFAQVFEYCADEVAHFDQGDFRQVVDPAHGVFAGVAGAGGDVQVAVGFRHIDTLMDRGDIGRARKRPNDAAGTENRQAAQNAQARVHGFQRQAFAVLHIYRDFKTAVVRALFGKLLQVLGHHPPWHRVDCRFAHRQDQAGTGHRAHACAGDKAHPRFSLQAHATIEQGTMGYIGVIASILESAGFGTVLT